MLISIDYQCIRLFRANAAVQPRRLMVSPVADGCNRLLGRQASNEQPKAVTCHIVAVFAERYRCPPPQHSLAPTARDILAPEDSPSGQTPDRDSPMVSAGQLCTSCDTSSKSHPAGAEECA